MLYWIIVITTGVAIGMLLGALLIAIAREFAREIVYAMLCVCLIGYVAFLYLGFSRGWFGAAIDWAMRALS